VLSIDAMMWFLESSTMVRLQLDEAQIRAAAERLK